MVGQQILDLLIGVRIPGGQPKVNRSIESSTISVCPSKGGNHERNATSETYWSKHWRPSRRLFSRCHSFPRHRRGAARSRHLPAVGPADVRRALAAGDSLSHGLLRRGQLHHSAARAQPAHAARTGGRQRRPCLEHRGHRGHVEPGDWTPLVSSRAGRDRHAVHGWVANSASCSCPPPDLSRTRQFCFRRSRCGGTGAAVRRGRGRYARGRVPCGSCLRWNRGERRERLPAR
jgi:hypothetical protein